jgi:hypothetical protein
MSGNGEAQQHIKEQDGIAVDYGSPLRNLALYDDRVSHPYVSHYHLIESK